VREKLHTVAEALILLLGLVMIIMVLSLVDVR
jgi:hypothetical protein